VAFLRRRHDRLCRESRCLHGRLDQAAFVASGFNYDATVCNLKLIGEAATHIPDAARSASPEVPSRQLIATRNRLIHGYLGIDNDTLWSIVRDDIPVLLPALRKLRDRSR
jgi:uncharacterized protein with HEPN domain